MSHAPSHTDFHPKQPDYRYDSAIYQVGSEKGDLGAMQTQDKSFKSNIRLLKAAVRGLSFVLAVYAVYSQVSVLHKYLETRYIIRNERGPWAKQTVLWPTVVMLATSTLTLVVSFITVIAYCWGVKNANKQASKYGRPAEVVEKVGTAVVWIGTAASYRIGKTGNDLWGWSCSTQAQAIQATFPEVNFHRSCDVQSGAWAVAIAQVILFFGSITIWILAFRRRRLQKRLHIQESMVPQNYIAQGQPPHGYAHQNPPNQAYGPYNP